MEKAKLNLHEMVEVLMENDKSQTFMLESIKRMLAAKEIMNSDDVCALFKIKPRTLANWRKQRKIPFVKLGKTVYYFLKDIMEHLKAMTQASETGKK